MFEDLSTPKPHCEKIIMEDENDAEKMSDKDGFERLSHGWSNEFQKCYILQCHKMFKVSLIWYPAEGWYTFGHGVHDPLILTFVNDIGISIIDKKEKSVLDVHHCLVCHFMNIPLPIVRGGIINEQIGLMLKDSNLTWSYYCSI